MLSCLLLISIDIKVFQTFGPSAQAAPILQILTLLAILLQTIDVKVLADLSILFPAASIDIQVLADLAFILFILLILAILLQTRRRNRHTEKRSGRPSCL